jgi:3-methyladenine DNA glycosylase AlkD
MNVDMIVTEKAIRRLLTPYQDAKRKTHDAGYIPSALAHDGCNLPGIRTVTKHIEHELKKTPWNNQRALLNSIWKISNNFAVLYVLLLLVDGRKKTLDLADWRVLKTWSKKIDNWAHSDVLSTIFASLLDTFPDELYPTLQKWNTSKLPWERRLSLVSLLCYARSRTNPLPYEKISALVEPRIHDEHFYVQRAVGWTLREAYVLYPTKTKKFVKDHLKDFSSIAFTTAIEKYSAKEKETFKSLRKKLRA